MKDILKMCSEKLLLLPFALMLMYPDIKAQEIIASLGGVSSIGNNLYSFTVGESVIGTGNNSELILSQGFHQPQKLMVQVYETSKKIRLQAYPNPTAEFLSVVYQKSKLNFTLLDITGRIIPLKIVKASDQQIEFSFLGLPAGIYLLKANTPSGDIVSFIHIVKL